MTEKRLRRTFPELAIEQAHLIEDGLRAKANRRPDGGEGLPTWLMFREAMAALDDALVGWDEAQGRTNDDAYRDGYRKGWADGNLVAIEAVRDHLMLPVANACEKCGHGPVKWECMCHCHLMGPEPEPDRRDLREAEIVIRAALEGHYQWRTKADEWLHRVSEDAGVAAPDTASPVQVGRSTDDTAQPDLLLDAIVDGVVGETGGIVRYRYSEQEEMDRCVCCPGRHVYNRYVERSDGPVDWALWVHRQLGKVADGRHIRVAVVLLDDEETK